MAIRGDVRRHRLAQRRDAVRRGIAVVTVRQRLAARLDDMVGGAEVGLPDPEIDDAAPGRLKGARAGQYVEGGLGPEPPHALGNLHVRLPVPSQTQGRA